MQLIHVLATCQTPRLSDTKQRAEDHTADSWSAIFQLKSLRKEARLEVTALTNVIWLVLLRKACSMETAYLKKCFGNSLTQALAEVARVQPSDPIEYLAYWLYHYADVLKAKEKQRQEELQRKKEHDRSLKKAKMTEMLEQEEKQIQQKCDKCHQELPPTAISSDKTPALQKDTAPLEKETMRQGPRPGVSGVIADMPQQVFSS
ncbi:DPY30 domain-containing protein 2 [Acomys russatus]|uniref:DPY30 domain-containing protein 2 n=1 Tax=Acomys russatus TaxID=60746 RepID=UPI0021E325BB|nr:DPY30 domain-containing protein 2 [Acomys russatus]